MTDSTSTVPSEPQRAIVFADDGCSVECVDRTTAVQYSIGDIHGERPHMLTFRTERDGDGLTNEAVLALLEHRLSVLNTKRPCRENALAITKLQEARFWLEERERRVRQEQKAESEP